MLSCCNIFKYYEKELKNHSISINITTYQSIEIGFTNYQSITINVAICFPKYQSIVIIIALEK